MPIKEVPLSTRREEMPEMTEENLKKALKAQMEKGGKDDLKMSEEEVDKFTKAFAEVRFNGSTEEMHFMYT